MIKFSQLALAVIFVGFVPGGANAQIGDLFQSVKDNVKGELANTINEIEKTIDTDSSGTSSPKDNKIEKTETYEEYQHRRLYDVNLNEIKFEFDLDEFRDNFRDYCETSLSSSSGVLDCSLVSGPALNVYFYEKYSDLIEETKSQNERASDPKFLKAVEMRARDKALIRCADQACVDDRVRAALDSYKVIDPSSVSLKMPASSHVAMGVPIEATYEPDSLYTLFSNYEQGEHPDVIHCRATEATAYMLSNPQRPSSHVYSRARIEARSACRD